MRSRHWLGTVGLAVSLAVAGVGACDDSANTSSSTGSTSNAGGSTSSADSTGSTSSTGFSNHGKMLSLAIDPPSAVIQVTNGASSPQAFAAKATFEDGAVETVNATWSFDRLDLGLVDIAGSVKAHGTLGGKGTVTATEMGLTATADVTVKLLFEQNPANLTPAQIGAFATPAPSPSGTFLYPYDKTVFARDIPAPELMWSGGAAGDSYFVHIVEETFEAKLYVGADPPSSVLMGDDVWKALTKSNAGEPVTVSVQRLSGSTALSPMTETWTVAQGSLRGTIYYWAVNQGQSMKISPGDTMPSVVFDSGSASDLGSPAPPNYDGTQPPWTIGVNGKRCVACHSVSKKGERMVGIFERKSSPASPFGTIDLTQTPSQLLQVSNYSDQTNFVALTPEGDYVVRNDSNFTLHLSNATTGAPIASAIDAYSMVADPSFSEDSKMLAFSSNITGSYPVEFSRADLDVVDFDPLTQAFTNRRTVVNGGASAIAFPSFSPDSKWLFYQRGDFSRATFGAGGVGHDDLFMAGIDGVVGEIPLDNANGVGHLDAKNLHLNYQPNANPVASGGYYWIVFFSPRDYGNKMVSTANPPYENRKQLWVAAVDLDPQPGQDPSHPAFYLRGQDLSTINMKGYWALDPCKQNGSSCDAGFECCEGSCAPDGMGNFQCQPPPMGCHQEGDVCVTDSDCCQTPPQKCIGGFCAKDSPD